MGLFSISESESDTRTGQNYKCCTGHGRYIMVSLLVFLTITVILANGDQIYSQETTRSILFPNDIKRFALSTEQSYEFSVQFKQTEVNELEGFMFQVHSQRHTVTLSESQDPVYGKYVKGTNIGLWKTLTSTETEFSYYVDVSSGIANQTTGENVTVLVAITSIGINASIPGGCTLTSPLETDPNIRLNYTSYTTTVSYEDGNVGYNPRSGSPRDCAVTYITDSVPTYQRVHYTVYHKVLNIGDYSEDHMFNAIEEMLTASSITDKKDSLPNFQLSSNGVKSTVIDSYAGDGVVYNVVAEVSGYPSTAYVPAVTYACNFAAGSSQCSKYINFLNVTVGVVLAIVGLFLLYGAHRLFHVEVYVFHSLIFMFLCYIGIGNLSFHASGLSVLELRLLISMAFALLLGGVLFLVWFFSGWYLPSVLLFTATAGFLIMSTLLFALSFTSVDSISIMKISYVYFLLFACGIVLIMIPAVIFPRAMNIISSSIIGSYLLIFSISMFSYTSLMDILMRVIKNGTLSGYMKTEANYSFGMKDIVLTLVWGVLLVTGIVLQACLAYKREPHFPEPSLYNKCTKKLKKKSDRFDTVNERSKLLGNYCTTPTSTNAPYNFK